MQQLRKVIVSVIIIAVLQLAKKFLNETSNAYTYYYNLVSCYQLLILTWCVFSILLEVTFLRRTKKKNAMLASLGIFIALICGTEGMCTYLLDHPKNIPSRLFSLFKIYYDDFDCRIIQYNPNCSRYNKPLFYEMKPNQQFVFSNREFTDSFYTNHLGLRDDEGSLNKPQVICIGDSYTLGWGNTEVTNFPSMIEKNGVKVLNVSMSSYGTAREIMKLNEIDLSDVRYIFWQYCFNDQEENRTYINNQFALPVQPYKSFDSVVQLHYLTRKYFPFRHFLTITKLGLRKLFFGKAVPTYSSTKPETIEEQEGKARDFLEIIGRLPIDLSKTRIIVFELGPYPMNGGFVDQVQRMSNQEKFKQKFKGNISILDVSSILRRYAVDVHILVKVNWSSALRASALQ
jgi:hypothetical protein